MSSLMTVISVFGDATASGPLLKSSLQPAILVLCTIAGIVATGFLVYGGILMSTSSGRPDRHSEAKRVIKNSLIGLVVVLAATLLTNILISSYAATNTTGTGIDTPIIRQVAPSQSDNGLNDVIIGAVMSLLRSIIDQSVGFGLAIVTQMTTQTPLMASVPSVFNLWIGIVGLADTLFILAIILFGFRIMSTGVLGIEEVELKHLIPKLIVAFLAINTSIFLIDFIIQLSNLMITALNKSFRYDQVWVVLSTVLGTSGSMQLPALIIYFVFLVLTFILIIYYLMRLIVLYLGAVLSPLLIILMLVPVFKDFAVTAFKTYVVTIFVLFVHVVILILASALLVGMSGQLTGPQSNPLLSALLGIAMLLSILKTQHVMNQLSFVGGGVRNMRSLGSKFIHGTQQIVRVASASSGKSSRPSGSAAKNNLVTITRIKE